jgi:hypothetical protein
MATESFDREQAESAIASDDPVALAASGDRESLERLRTAEEVLERKHHRQQRQRRVPISAQAVVGFVALAGFFANAFQNWSSEKRWQKEFERTQATDRQKTFFEITGMATEPSNPDKRLVGYALLKEFMDDDLYREKAKLLLEEALGRELRENNSVGIDEQHSAAFVAILSALARTSSCRALEDSTSSINLVAKRKTMPVEERAEILHVYVRWLIGRAAELCTSFADLQFVRKPLADALVREPELGGLRGKIASSRANAAIAQILRDHCEDEIGSTDVASCSVVLKKYGALCNGLKEDTQAIPEESAACQALRETPASAGPGN